MGQGEKARVFVVVDSDEAVVRQISATLRVRYENCVIYEAKDGYEASFKMKNVVPDLLITNFELQKYYPGHALIDGVLKEGRLSGTSIIVTADVPKTEMYVNEVLSGRLQFLARPLVTEQILKSVHVALTRGARKAEIEFEMVHLSAGQTLFKQGEIAAAAFLLKSGKLRAQRVRDNVVTPLGEVNPGEFVGEMAHINGEPRSAEVVAVEDSELVEVPLGSLDTLIFSKPAWSRALLQTLSKRLKLANSGKG